ncbi:MAG: NAD(P)H-binding protein [Actinomycetota bacterium]
MKVLVAGGTGFLGRHIAVMLSAAGHDIAVLSRSPSKVASVPGLGGMRALGADVTSPESLRGKLDGFDAVVGAVQFPNHPVEVPRKGLTYDRYDREGTENLVAEAVSAGVRHYVYISGAGADVASDKSWYRAKGYAELVLTEAGLDHAIVRPSWAYGPEDRALNRFAKIARFSPVVPRLGVKPQVVQPIHVDDVAEAVRRIFDRQAWRQVFEVGGPETMTMDEIIKVLLGVLGKRRLVLPIPKLLAQAGTAPFVLLPKPPMTPFGIDFAMQDGVVDTRRAADVLGVEPVPLAEGLRRYM